MKFFLHFTLKIHVNGGNDVNVSVTRKKNLFWDGNSSITHQNLLGIAMERA